jgi:adenosine/AMP kinase
MSLALSDRIRLKSWVIGRGGGLAADDIEEGVEPVGWVEVGREVVLAETEQGRGILGVVDGFSPRGVEDEGEIKWRQDFLRQIGYKLG